MMAPNDAKKRVARHYLFLRIKRTTVNGVLLEPTKPNNVKTNQNKTNMVLERVDEHHNIEIVFCHKMIEMSVLMSVL